MVKLHYSSLTSNLLVIVAFLLPLFFLPFTSDLFDINKRFLFIALTLVLLLLAAIQAFFTKELRITRTPWTTPIILFGVSTLATILVVSPNKIHALAGIGGTYLAFSLCYLVATSLIKRNFTDKLITALSLAGIVITLTSLVDRFGISLSSLLNRTFGLAIPEGTKLFVTGSPLFSVFFLALVVLMLAIGIFQRKSKSDNASNIVFALICSVGIIVNALGLLPSSPTHPQFLSLLDSWSIATDVLKTPVNAVVGVGTDSYATAFSIFKPARLNQSPLWFVRFNNARNSILEIMTTQGVFGALAWILVLFTTVRLLKTSRGEQWAIGAGTLFIEALFLIFPPNILLVSLLCIFLVAWSASLKERQVRTRETVFSLLSIADPVDKFAPQSSRFHAIVSQVVSAVLILAVICGFYAVGRAYAAEFFFSRSLIAATKGNGKDTYDNAVKAIVTNPYMENYHRAFAITNLSLAQAISQNPSLTDQDKQNVVTLIQQAIQQAKIASTLDALDTANWDTLSTVYQALIGTAQGADQWTIASYVEQIKTDPSNPQIRFALGSVYRQIGNDDQALQLFQQTTQLKPDYANAYFNMADIYKKKGDKQNEFAMLQATLSLVTPEQNGYSDVKKRYDELAIQLAAPAATKQVAPSPTPTPKPSPSPSASPQAVQLPNDSGLTPTGSIPEVPKQ